MRIRLRVKARSDLQQILSYSLAQHGEAVATAYLRAIAEVIERLAEHPEFGAPCPDLAPNLRSVSAREHRVYYLATAQRVSILRVLHKAMDAGRHL